MVVVVLLGRVSGDVLFTADFRRPRQTNVGMFQSVDGDCKFLGESETVHHDSLVIRRCGVEQCQQMRFSALVELGRFPSNDLEPPSRCSDNNDLGIERPSNSHLPRCSRVFGHIAECRFHSTKLGGPCQG